MAIFFERTEKDGVVTYTPTSNRVLGMCIYSVLLIAIFVSLLLGFYKIVFFQVTLAASVLTAFFPTVIVRIDKMFELNKQDSGIPGVKMNRFISSQVIASLFSGKLISISVPKNDSDEL